MFLKNDMIVYADTGVCRVMNVGIPAHLAEFAKGRQYYELEPLYSVGTIYIPVDAPTPMRAVMTKTEAEKLINSIPDVEEEDLSGLDARALTEKYKTVLGSQQCVEMVRLIKTVRKKAKAAKNGGRRPGKLDREYSKRARELLYGELSVALDLPVDQVEEHIHEYLGIRQDDEEE